MNAPDRADLVVLEEGVPRVRFQKEAKVQNAATFVLQKEDHTLGNLLRMQLLEDERVEFAGYIVRHPLLTSMEIRVQTKEDTYTPTDALVNAIQALNAQLDALHKDLKEKLDTSRAVDAEAYER